MNTYEEKYFSPIKDHEKSKRDLIAKVQRKKVRKAKKRAARKGKK